MVFAAVDAAGRVRVARQSEIERGGRPRKTRGGGGGQKQKLART